MLTRENASLISQIAAISKSMEMDCINDRGFKSINIVYNMR